MTRINRPPRIFGYAATFIALVWLTLEQGWSFWTLVLAAAYFLVYPHLVYWYDVWRRSTVSIERYAMPFDSFMAGFWTAHIDFSAGISYTLFTCVILNNTMTGGIRQCRMALVWWGLGVLVSVLMSGFTWAPAAPLGVDVLIMACLLTYVFSVAWVFNEQNQRLWGVKQSVERANTVFQSMLNLSELRDKTDSFESLVESALNELQALYPKRSFGFVLHDPQKEDAFHFSAFTHELTAVRHSEIMRCMSADYGALSDGYTLKTDKENQDCVIYALPEQFGQFRGFLVIEGPTLTPTDQNSLKLLVKQLGTTIANKLLTMELKSAAERDALTGARNRGSLDLELDEAQARFLADNSRHFAVLLIDLIGLKRVNDQYGHEAGDTLICAAAEALQSTCRDQDGLFRFGGDEFVILCRDETGSGAEALLRRIRDQVHGRQVTFVTADGVEQVLTIELSVGLASTDQVDPARVMQMADARMYQHKQDWYRAHPHRWQAPSGSDGPRASLLG